VKSVTDSNDQAFKTILASATITEDVAQFLRSLFGQTGDFQQVAAPVVRPEPSYWSAVSLPPETREKYLLEAVRHLPRPAIIYTTLKQEEKARPGTLTPSRIQALLRDHGFRRVTVVTGDSSATDREEALRGLRGPPEGSGRYDVVIATSAFGLGIDIPDVRTIIHACMPESLDRYYQEVGRAGRDGKASISMLLATTGDLRVAKKMASPAYLTAQRTRQRWDAMWNGRRQLDNDLVALPVTAMPRDIRRHSDWNEKWNLLTLSLMARSGVLDWDFNLTRRGDSDHDPYSTEAVAVQANAGFELLVSQPGHRAREELISVIAGEVGVSSEFVEKVLADQLGEETSPGSDADWEWITVRIRRWDFGLDSFWTQTFEPERTRLVDNSDRSFKRLREALSGRRCCGKLIAESYEIVQPQELRTMCVPSCGGCRYCRANGRDPWQGPAPKPAAIERRHHRESGLAQFARRGTYGDRLIVGTSRPVAEMGMDDLAQTLITLSRKGDAPLLVVPCGLRERIAEVLGEPDMKFPLMIDVLEDFDATTAIGVSMLILPQAEDSRLPEFLEGSPRAPLTIVLGHGELRVGTRTLSQLDGFVTRDQILDWA
jgi:hypothetical protein